MLINGEKYACDACIRGHRVSSCQHHERPLSHINRKGRPVSQCPHCRGLRKTRASHVNCQCGEKPHSKAECKNGTGDKANRKQCCCGHGGRCICSAKRDSNLATVPEVGPAPEPKSTFQAKQLHIPASKIDPLAVSHRSKVKHNNTSKLSHPYTLPRSHTIHTPAELARRSADHLPLAEEMSISRSVPAQPDSITSAPRPRRARSEHSSPVLGISAPDMHLPSLDIPFSSFDPASLPSPLFDYPQQWAGLYYADSDLALEAASLGPPSVDWSTFDLSYGSDALTATYSQPPSFASFDYANFSHPELSRSSSHDTSEPEDIAPRAVSTQDPKLHEQQDVHTVNDTVDADTFYLCASPSRLEMTHPHMPSINYVGPLDTDPYWRLNEQVSVSAELQPYPLPHAFSQQSSAPVDGQISLDNNGVLTTAGTSEPIWIPSASPFPPVLSPLPAEAGRIMDHNQWRL
ncbi:transcriptional activator haa1 [Ophidiomyces ophidiicola]|uniref:Transcriptional activator haa1 n=1 Tax=Ophidiomyces ophidiicola TaxID=1387563 RepID=A0ACB8V4P0_9EURO|nr:transcriptional activator haa1 [Ophidiomyces ophidiicola]KAI1910396.1 transcriptional activator haa1 [Ophidiomyces ophidiicola]KAI1916076.1 transcriptional activator haa1 [Ophidiomyces ophidiicola]KAI1920414.1 transcriptional activator haa1 [Ophidiomyces ophidiicola]KAI1938829.1 transcriptional activator haa1 [Ophidiomyces ophidiicola]KAI1941543.1 transcriptional activator haa1 [Ophidiomyces ophidiicola]